MSVKTLKQRELFSYTRVMTLNLLAMMETVFHYSKGNGIQFSLSNKKIGKVIDSSVYLSDVMVEMIVTMKVMSKVVEHCFGKMAKMMLIQNQTLQSQ